MTVQSIESLGYTPPDLYSTNKPDSMGKEDFLKLLIAQLQQQDPLNPQDPAEFTSQLTQFSNLEQLMTVNESIGDMNDSIVGLQMLQMSANNTQAVSLIGKEALHESDTIAVVGGQAQTLHFYAASNLAGLQATLIAPDGSTARVLELGPRSSGVQEATWDGLSDDGSPLPDGDYTVRLTATGASGGPADVASLALGRVAGVGFEGGQTYLDINGRRVALGDIFSVRELAA